MYCIQIFKFKQRVIYVFINKRYDYIALSYHQLFHPIEHFPAIFSIGFVQPMSTRLAYFQASIFHNINAHISSVRKWMSKVRVTFHGKWRDKKCWPRLAALLFFFFFYSVYFFPFPLFPFKFFPSKTIIV